MAVITISRQFGAGGITLGKMVAEKYGYVFADTEVIKMVAEMANVSTHFVETIEKEATGDGPVAACFSALDDATGVQLTLRNFEVHSATGGEDALGGVTVTVEHDNASYRGQGTSVDIVEAGCRAYLDVINRVIRRNERGAPSRLSSTASHTVI